MMVPALKEEVVDIIESVKDIVLSEVNVKELEILRDVSGVLVKRIKPDFKKLGPKYGKLMKQIAGAVAKFNQDDIQKLEERGAYQLEIDGQEIILTMDDVDISTEDIPGWLVMTEGDLPLRWMLPSAKICATKALPGSLLIAFRTCGKTVD